MFNAFISYSHAADGTLAAALQQGLHRFAKPSFKLRAIRVFRDETTLAMTPRLWPEIEKALRNSRFFILMADPLSAQSEWVQKEVACWLEMGRTDNMLIVWTGGGLAWAEVEKDFEWDQTNALPRLLAGAFDGYQPLYLDLRWARTEVDLSRKHPKFASALARLSATIRGRSLDEIFGEDVREQRRRLRFLWTGITILLLATLFAGWGWWAELQARDAAEEQARIANARRLATESASALTKYPQRSLLLAVETVKVGQPLHGVRVAAAEQSLRDALGLVGGWPLVPTQSAPSVVRISPDNHWLVTGSDDHTARLWDLTAKDPTVSRAVLRGHDGAVTTVEIGRDSHWLVTASSDGTARLWDLTARDLAISPLVLLGHEGAGAVGINPNGHWLLASSAGGTARLWDLSANDPPARPVVLSGHWDVVAVEISANAHWVVTGGTDETVRLWDLTAKDPAARPLVLSGHEGWVTAVGISPDNRWLVAGSGANGLVRLWDLTAKDPAASRVVLRGHEGPVTAVGISLDCRWLVTGGDDKAARLWDLTSRDLAASSVVLRGHAGPVDAVGISPDNHWLVTGSKDDTARVWDLTAKDPAASPVILHGHEGGVSAVGISPDNQWVMTASDDKTARLWPLSVKELTNLARDSVGRNFSGDEWQLYFAGEPYHKTFAEYARPTATLLQKAAE